MTHMTATEILEREADYRARTTKDYEARRKAADARTWGVMIEEVAKLKAKPEGK